MKPRVIVYNAVSLDGQTEGFQADVGCFYESIPKWGEHATLCGCDTLLNAPDKIPDETAADLAPLAVKSDDERPILVVPDSRGRLRTWHYWKKQPYWRDFVVLCAENTPEDYIRYLKERYIRSIIAGTERVDFEKALSELHSIYGVGIVRVDSGGTLNGVLLRNGLVDEVHLLVHPVLVGGTNPKSFFQAAELTAHTDAVSLRFKAVEKQPGDMILLSYDVTN